MYCQVLVVMNNWLSLPAENADFPSHFTAVTDTRLFSSYTISAICKKITWWDNHLFYSNLIVSSLHWNKKERKKERNPQQSRLFVHDSDSLRKLFLGYKKLKALKFEKICDLLVSDMADGTSLIFGVLWGLWHQCPNNQPGSLWPQGIWAIIMRQRPQRTRWEWQKPGNEVIWVWKAPERQNVQARQDISSAHLG